MNKYLLTALAILGATTVSARHLTPEEALGRLSTTPVRHAPAAVVKAPELIYSATAGDLERVYVFSNAARKGFMVLSADDVAPAVLAYSDTEIADTDNLPDNLRYWLDEYARQIAYAAENGISAKEAEVKQRAGVAPKLTTVWDQTEPFNEMTPMHAGMPTPTGCVATAVAQIMNWHKWPAKPHGKKTYNSYYIGELTVDFDRVTFDWDKMLDRYYRTSPAENINAVATLMMAVGYASEMTYQQKASGAMGYNAAIGLFTYFDYSKGMSLERREWYGIEEWDDLVYAELTENGPVYYEGTGDGGGHAFVCDGYDAATGFFHFNWGWTGRGDGFYRLSALNPDYQGTGGNSLGYNYTQDILRGLRKATPGVEDATPLIVAPRMGVVTPFETAQLGDPITIKGYDTLDGFCNYSLATIKDLTFGVRFRNDATGDSVDVASTNEPADFPPYNKVNIIRFIIPTTLAEGNYTLDPLWRSGETGEWHPMLKSPLTRNDVPMELKGTTATFGFGTAEARVEAILTEGPDFYTTNGDFNLKGSITAVGTKDFSSLLCAVFMYFDSKNQPQVADQGEAVRFDIPAGQTVEFNYKSKPQNGKLIDGNEYYIAIGNVNTGELVSPIYPAKIGNRYGALQMEAYNFDVDNRQNLDPEDVNVKAVIRMISGEYHGPLALGLAKKRNPFTPERILEGQPVDLVAVSENPVTIHGTIDQIEALDIYYAHLMYKDAAGNWAVLSQYPINLVFTKSYYSGVENVAVDSAEAVYYDTYGRKVDNPVAGRLYIVVTPDGKARKVRL